jgi:probable F420-dependent oxidoreductase
MPLEFWQAIAHTEPDQIVEVARLAEQLGFGAVTTGDHFVTPARIDSTYPYTADGRPWVRPQDSFPEPMVLAAAIGQATVRLRYFVTCYVLPMREPLFAAKAISSAAVLCRDRLILGVGIGWMREEFELAGQDFATRGARCDEQLEILEQLLRGGMVEHRGRFFAFPALQMSPVPDRPLPILIAGHSDAAFRRAARFAGWSAAHYDPSEVAPLVSRFQEIWREAGRRDEPLITLPTDREPTLDECKRLRDLGVSALINMPLTFQGEPTSTLARKREVMERYAGRLIAKLGA